MKHNTNINLNGFRIKSGMKQFESGRSMIETIGVLAVIGVLTIGGIAGYNYAINKHRANQVLQDIRLIYQETKYPNTVRQIVETGSFPDLELDTQSSYEYSFTFPDLKDFIYDSTSETVPNLISVNVSGVPDTACDILLKTKPEYVLMLKANGQSVWSCDKDENELSYIFEITSDSLEYGTCSVCTGEHCFDDDLNCPEGEYCYNDTCSKCKAGYTKNTNGDCISCGFTSSADLTQSNCLRCDNTYIHPTTGGCFSCNIVDRATKEQCESRCSNTPNVVWMGTDENYGSCGPCEKFGWYNGATKEQCEKCKEINPNIIFYRFYSENDTTGLCANCGYWGDKLKKNAAGTSCESSVKGYFWDITWPHSLIKSCTTTESGRYTSKTECDKCPERYFDGTNNRNGKCDLCPTGQVKDTSAEGDGRRCVNAPAN